MQLYTYVGSAAVLRAIGRLEVAAILTGAPLYDPSVHFRQIKHQGETPLARLAAGLDRVGAPGGGQPRLTAPADMGGAKIYAG